MNFDDVMACLRASDQKTAAAVFWRFADRLVALADSQLPSSVQSKVDPDDVVQSVFRSFFRRCGEGGVTASDWNELWALLVVITVRKCRNRLRHYRAGCRDVRREVNLDEDNTDEGPWWQAIDREPTPLEAAALREVLQQLLDSFDPPERPIIELSLQGFTAGEISRRVQRAERTVSRVCQRFRRRLGRLLGEPCE